MEFKEFAAVVRRQFDSMKSYPLYSVQVDKTVLWNTYLDSFPEGTNPVRKERTEHDCQTCRSFIRAIGNVIAIVNNEIVSIWDIKEEIGYFKSVVDELSLLVHTSKIDNIFLNIEPKAGIEKTFDLSASSTASTWFHLFTPIPPANVCSGTDIGPRLNIARTTKDVMLRSLMELSLESVDIVLDLIQQNSLYRGEEHLFVLTEFRKLKVKFNKLENSNERDIFCWSNVNLIPAPVAKMRGTAIGTLLEDLSEGKDLEDSIKSFESKIAPANYKRTTAVVTKGMIEKAQNTVIELGLESALERRYANIEDITINNILFADRSAKKAMNVFDSLISKVPEKAQNLSKIEEINIETFISDILPTVETVEVMFENKLASNLVSLIAPVNPDSKNMFKWPNKFSWCYTGEVTDSIKEKVKSAGGKIDGDFRASLSWSNYDDLDLHLFEPGFEINFRAKISPKSKGELDVDMNAGGRISRSPVENIFYTSRKTMPEGNYRIMVHNYSARETVDVGFELEMEFDGVIHHFSYPKRVANDKEIDVVTFKYTHKDGIEIIKSIPSSQSSKNVWGIATQTFQKVNVIMYSPNHWDNKPVGNKHYFFMLDKCINDGQARGFFNEYLTEELNVHRKVFEVVGAKMKTDESSKQLSGIGLSSTQRNSLLVRVTGSFTRTVKVTF